MDNTDSSTSFNLPRSREPSNLTATSTDRWPVTFLTNRPQEASSLSRRASASLRGQSEPQASSSSSTFQANTSFFNASSDTSAIWAQQSSRWSASEPNGHSLRRAGSSPAPGLRHGSSDTVSSSANQPRFASGQQAPAPSYLGGPARNSITSLGFPPPSRMDFTTNDISAATLPRQMDHLTLNQNPFEAPSSSAAPAFASQSQRNNFQTATAFSSPGAGANAVPHHLGSAPGSTTPPGVFMPRQGQSQSQGLGNSRESYTAYQLGISDYPQASGPAAFQLDPASVAWNNVNFQANGNANANANANATGAASHLQNRNIALPNDQYNYVPSSVAYQQQQQQQGYHGYNADTTAALLNRQPSMQTGVANQTNQLNQLNQPPPFVQNSDSQMMTLQAAMAHSIRQVTGSSYDVHAAANDAATARSTIASQILQEQYLQSRSRYFPASVPLPQTGLSLSSPLLRNATAASPRDRDPLKNMKSSLLRTFLESKGSRNFDLMDIVGHVVEFSGDQHGSRFIQTKLVTANKETKDAIFAEMADNIIPLAKDVFGNYVVQKFLEYGSQKQKEYIAEKMKGRMVDLSMHCYSCRVVQRAMQNALLEHKLALVRELDGHVIRVVKDNSGNHVIQRVMKEIDRADLDFLVDALRPRVIELSTHNYGCRIIQMLYEIGTDADQAMVVAEIRDHIPDLSMNPFGNYVIQKIIQEEDAAVENRSIIINGVIDKLAPMCKQKFASNVVEACIIYGSPEDRRRIREELNKVDSHNVSVLHQLTNDAFGNYVLQKLLRLLDGEDQRLFAEALSAEVELHREAGSGRTNAAIDRLADALAQLEKDWQEKASNSSSTPSPPVFTVSPVEVQGSPNSSQSPSVGSAAADNAEIKTSESVEPAKAPLADE